VGAALTTIAQGIGTAARSSGFAHLETATQSSLNERRVLAVIQNLRG
jgi:hypothetical protein